MIQQQTPLSQSSIDLPPKSFDPDQEYMQQKKIYAEIKDDNNSVNNDVNRYARVFEKFGNLFHLKYLDKHML